MRFLATICLASICLTTKAQVPLVVGTDGVLRATIAVQHAPSMSLATNTMAQPTAFQFTFLAQNGTNNYGSFTASGEIQLGNQGIVLVAPMTVQVPVSLTFSNGVVEWNPATGQQTVNLRLMTLTSQGRLYTWPAAGN